MREAISHLKVTKSFKNKNISFGFAEETAPSVGPKITVLKKMSLGIGVGGDSTCGNPTQCHCCSVVPLFQYLRFL